MPIELVGAEIPVEDYVAALEDAGIEGLLTPDLKERLAALVADSRSGVKKTVDNGSQKSELPQEEIDRLIFDMETRFLASDKGFQDTVDWGKVEQSIRLNKMALCALQSLESAGGKPTFIGIDGDCFVFQGFTDKSDASGLRCTIKVENVSL